VFYEWEYDSSMPSPGKIERLWIDAQEWGLRRLDRIKSSAKLTVPHLVTGVLGERAALFELRRQGYVVVARRWTSTRMRGDVDLIAWEDDHLCFIEVKTRSERTMTPAQSAVDEHKRRMFRNLARAYLRVFPEQQRKTIPVRFDVLSVYVVGGHPEFDFFKGAFGW